MENTIICSNQLCGKKYNKDFENCPFCGAANPLIVKQKKELEIERRKAIDQKLEQEKQLEIESGGLYKSNFRLIMEGGNVSGEKGMVWMLLPIYIYPIAIISFAAFIIIGVLIFFSDYPINNWIYWGGALSISGLLFFISAIIQAHLIRKGFDVMPANNKAPTAMNTFNGIGAIAFGCFRKIGMTHVSYVFLTLLVPLIPIGCYRVEKGEKESHKEGAIRKETTPYKIYGSERWNWMEVLYVYLFSYSIFILIICLIYLLLELMGYFFN